MGPFRLRWKSLPALQPAGSRACIACGAPAAAFCARCGVAPYCGQRCQRRDWAERHRDVCHNLARSDVTSTGVDPATLITPPPQLRRPKSPANREAYAKKDDDNPSDKGNKKFTSPGLNDAQKPQRFPRSNDRSFNNDNNDRSYNNDKNDRSYNNDRNYRSSNNDRSGRSNNDRSFNGRNQGNGPRNNAASAGRRPALRHEKQPQDDDEDWGPKKASNPQPSTSKAEEPKLSPPTLEAKPVPGPTQQEAKPVPGPTQQEAKPVPGPSQQEAKPVPGPSQQEAKPVPGPTQQEAKPVPGPSQQEAKPVPGPFASVNDVSPVKKFVPKNYLIETLSISDTVVVSVQNTSAECRIKSGLVCLHMNVAAEQLYEALLEPLATACQQAPAIQPAIGDMFGYLEPSEEAWYRARRLSPTLAALVDAGRVVSLAQHSKTHTLPDTYIEIAEFCCVLHCDNVKVGDSLNCTIITKTPRGYKVSIVNMDNEANLGEGEIARWIPEVELPKPAENAQVTVAEVPRPALVSGSKVFIVHAEAPDKIIVRGADAHQQTSFETALQLANGSGEPLKEPPQKGDTVVAKFTDGLKYRALVMKTNVKQKRYMLEYIEFGNTHIATQEDLYPCPAEISLSNLPTVSSIVKVSLKELPLSEKAIEYLLMLRDNDVEVLVTSPDGAKTIPNGGECVLTGTKTNENLNRKLEQLSTPEWKKVEQTTGNVTDIQTVMFTELEYLDLPADGCELEIVDFSTIDAKTVNGYQKGHAHAKYVFEELTEKMAEYCNSPLGQVPYMPKAEELCIAQCPGYPQWFRAVVLEAAAGKPARVLYVDYGNAEHLQLTHMRRITRDFVTGKPALATTIEIRGFPDNPTDVQLTKALEHMQMNDEGRGVLKVTRCEKQDDGIYTVDAPDLIAAVLK